MSACSSSAKRKRKTISLDEKAAIPRAVAAGTKKSQVAKEFDICRARCQQPSATKMSSRTLSHEAAGWLQRLKERHDIVGKVISGECQAVDKEEATVWTNIDLYMAMEMLQAAWISVTASIIANCFRHASFARDGSNFGDDESVDFIAVPDEAAASDEVVAMWKVLHDAGVVSQKESFCGYVSADADVVTAEELTDEDIMLADTGTDDKSDDDCIEDCDAPQSCVFPVPTSS
ncbi:hypothetical protein HPB47_008000 [Ixodes persulcatus]|uniref:Uncharacterized protein n=1 Tax=Ixodes persulcatus TaxID=34615 RepID=A0AC60P6Q3_IXOPE|nr:hypothetical protein HPB47_008000 [Ixodes persulcatus]